jgi:uncharacterized membrane protein YobD (UPF0266 family)
MKQQKAYLGERYIFPKRFDAWVIKPSGVFFALIYDRYAIIINNILLVMEVEDEQT